MANTIPSPYMNMPVPAVGTDPSPDWALNINSCLLIIDGHNHSLGTGNQVTPAGLNINADLTIQQNNLTNIRTVRFFPQSTALSLPADVGCLYEAGVDLYYNDGSGNQIRITQGGSVTGASGTITGLPSGTASASYSGGTFVFQSATNTPATIDAGSYIFRNLTSGSNGVTVSPVNSLGSNYNLVLPTLPASTSIMQLDNSGNITAVLVPDNSTIVIASNTLEVGVIGPSNLPSGFGLVPTGTITAFGGVSAPSGYLLCDGTSYLIATYPTLAAALFDSATSLYAYGSADSTHFNVPDLRGQFLRGVTGASPSDPDASSRTSQSGTGNTGNNVGSSQGYQIQSHSHNAQFGNNYTSPPTSAAVSSNNAGDFGIVQNTGGNETRPINVYVNYIIKT